MSLFQIHALQNCLRVEMEKLMVLQQHGEHDALPFCENLLLKNFQLPFLRKEFAKIDLQIKDVHKDASCTTDLKIGKPKTYKLTVHMFNKTYQIDAKENETLLVAMERAGLNAPNRCRAGGCGWCHAKLIKGKYQVAEKRDKRRAADKKFGFIHTCITYPLSDIEIDVPKDY